MTYSFLRQQCSRTIIGRALARLSEVGNSLLVMIVSLLRQCWRSAVARNSKQVHKEELHSAQLSLKLKEELFCKDIWLCQGRYS